METSDKTVEECFSIEREDTSTVLRLVSASGTNTLSRARVMALRAVVEGLAHKPMPLILAGNHRFFSAGADLKEIASLKNSEAYDFALLGGGLMQAIDDFPAPVIAAIEGYCMGGGLDLALACDWRICSPHAIFGHRGAALGIMTGWGGTQRLPRLIGKARAMQMFLAAEKVSATRALQLALVNQIADDSVVAAKHICLRYVSL